MYKKKFFLINYKFYDLIKIKFILMHHLNNDLKLKLCLNYEV